MTTNSTASNYISKINQNYPIAGQDNDSSGFRNNFKNIKSALDATDQDVQNLKLSSVKTTGPNNFNNNLIKQAVFQNTSALVYDNTGETLTGDVQLDYSNGSYQKIRIDGGTHVFTVVNWPEDIKSGSMILSVITDSVVGSYVNFDAINLKSLGPDPFPLQLTANAEQFFQLWCDGDSTHLYVKGLGGSDTLTVAELIDQASHAISTTTSLTINTNVFATSKNTSTQYATPYAMTMSANHKIGELALVPNKIIVRTSSTGVLDAMGDNIAKTFPVYPGQTNGIMTGAVVNFPASPTTVAFTVTSITSSTITVNPPFQVDSFSVNDYVTVINPQFTEQAILATLTLNPVTTTTSVSTDIKGQIYANTSTLYVAFADHLYGTFNKIKVSGDNVHMVTQPIATTSTALATTEFVHNIMPYGAIIMWHGAKVAIPAGWALCDGTNSTPNLVDRFIVGAGSTYAVAATGGSTISSVGIHSHVTTVTDNGHAHGVKVKALAQSQTGSGALTGGNSDTAEDGAYSTTTDSAVTGLTVSVASTGTNDVGTNLPPYYALCYIMKTTGAGV